MNGEMMRNIDVEPRRQHLQPKIPALFILRRRSVLEAVGAYTQRRLFFFFYYD